ncbi:MAG: CNNM domain-containing protein [Phycisphaerales bacterium]
MTREIMPWLALSIAGVVLSALFSGIEIGVYTLNRIGLLVRVGRGDRSARILSDELARPDRVLSTLLVGNNLVNYASGLGIAAILELYHLTPLQSVVVNTALLLPITFVFGETLPKDLFRTYADRWMYVFARYLRGWRLLLTWIAIVPIVGWFGAVVRRRFGSDERAALLEPRQRISRLIREGVHAGVLSESQTTFADRALTLRGRTVDGEMTRWSKVTWLPLECGSEERARILRRSFASRLPVLDSSGKLVGVLTALDAILEPTVSTAALMEEPIVFAPRETSLSALRTMRATRTRLAVVADPTTHQPLGVVAIKDLVDPVTGHLVGS